jgi:hypothetical protein
VAIELRNTIRVKPVRKTVAFGETIPGPLPQVDVVYLLDPPQTMATDSGKRTTQTGRLYARRGVDLKDADTVPLPEGDFDIVGGARLDHDHPFNGHNFGVVRFNIRRGG